MLKIFTQAAQRYEARLVGKIDVLKATAEGEIDEVRRYLTDGGDINVRDEVRGNGLRVV